MLFLGTFPKHIFFKARNYLTYGLQRQELASHPIPFSKSMISPHHDDIRLDSLFDDEKGSFLSVETSIGTYHKHVNGG